MFSKFGFICNKCFINLAYFFSLRVCLAGFVFAIQINELVKIRPPFNSIIQTIMVRSLGRDGKGRKGREGKEWKGREGMGW